MGGVVLHRKIQKSVALLQNGSKHLDVLVIFFTLLKLNDSKNNNLLFLEGPFQSDALLVPEGCLFDHIHNTTRCWPFLKWNQTGALACKERNMQIRSFAMLLPCGISLFSGVEFVCCPKETRSKI